MPLEIAQAMPNAAARAAIVLGQDLPFWYPINAVLTANQVGIRKIVQVDNDSEFEWRSLIATSTGLFSVVLTDNFIKRPLMPTPVNSENLVGTAQQPAFLPVPRRLARTTIMQAEFTDRSGAGNTIQLCLAGYKKFTVGARPNFIPSVLGYRKAISHVYLPSIAELAQLDGKIPYWWPIFDATIAAQQAGRNKFTIPDGCYWTHIVASSSQAAGFVLQLYDTERQQIFEDQPTVVNAGHAGSSQRPFWLKKVYKLPANGQMQCRVINLAAVANAVQVILCGVRD
jgi:hypothetical protein